MSESFPFSAITAARTNAENVLLDSGAPANRVTLGGLLVRRRAEQFKGKNNLPTERSGGWNKRMPEIARSVNRNSRSG